MKFRKLRWVVGITMVAILLSSCGESATPAPTQDIGAIQTEAFAQVMTQAVEAYTPTSQATNTAEPTATLSVPPTIAPIGGGGANTTPLAFETQLPGLTPQTSPSPIASLAAGALPTITTENGCNNGILIAEGKPYDGEYVTPGVEFAKVWSFQNIGTCTWDEGYAFVFLPELSTPGFKGYTIPFRKAQDHTPPGKGISFIIKITPGGNPGEYQGFWKLRDDGGNFFGSLVWVKYMVNKKE